MTGIHDTIANFLSRLDSGLAQYDNANWMMFRKCWSYYTMRAASAESIYNHQTQINMVFAIAARKMYFTH